MKCECGRVGCETCLSQTLFHVAANPGDRVQALAGRYRAAFGSGATEKAEDDYFTADDLGLKSRKQLLDRVAWMLRTEDRRRSRREKGEGR